MLRIGAKVLILREESTLADAMIPLQAKCSHCKLSSSDQLSYHSRCEQFSSLECLHDIASSIEIGTLIEMSSLEILSTWSI